ncbi:MAG: hypothetical protein ACLF0P_08400, partial [Thermoanaerobaculia bacterium]
MRGRRLFTALAGLVAVCLGPAGPPADAGERSAPASRDAPARPAAVPSAPSPAAGGAVLEFDSLNGPYHFDDADIEPVRQGPVTIHLAAPRSSLVLQEHSVTLQPLGDGTHRAGVSLRLLGRGDLVADLVTSAGSSSRLKDLVVLPRQTVDVEGRVRFQRVPGGWDVTALALPEAVEVDIQSRLAGSLVTLCSQLAVFLGMDCDGLDRSLSRVEVP